MNTRTGGEVLVDSLLRFGVDTVFGIPGVHNLGLYEALRKRPELRHILTRHEQGAAFMADGYARVSGRPGVAVVTTGPGALNTLTPLGEAYTDSSPVLVVATNVERKLLETRRGTLHELRDQPGAFRAVIGQCERVMSADDIGTALQRAWSVLCGPRGRPAALDMPNDVLVEPTEATTPDAPPRQRREPRHEDVRRAADLLRRALRPLVFAGGGVISAGATSELRALAERLRAPVITTAKGKGAIPEDHPLSAGYFSASLEHHVSFVQSRDVVVLIGTRLAGGTASLWQAPCPQSIIRIDADPTELTGGVTPTIEILADARSALVGLVRELGTVEPAVYGGFGQVRSTTRARAAAASPWTDAVMRAIRASMPRDGVLCLDMTMAAYQAPVSFEVYEPRTLLMPRGFGTLGFALPAAIGAKAAAGDRPVTAVVGDGGFQFTMQELATAIQHELPFALVVVNDHCYTSVKRAQERQFDATFAVELANPDFQQIAAAYGIQGELVPDPERLSSALKKAQERSRPTLIEIRPPLS